MHNIVRLFCDDIKRITGNVVTGIIVLGLIFLPSLFSWYNILACWNVFDNTGNLTVAVASVDEGYKSDLVPIEMNVGENVVSALRANNQLNWVFTDEEDAIDGAESGKYYAAVVIPEQFSRDMMTFYTEESESAQIIYYTNEKKSAVAPKVTDQGADRVSYQVNEVFSQTLSDVALGLAAALSKYVDVGDTSGQLSQLASHIGTMSNQMGQASSILTAYAGVVESSRGLVTGSSQMLSQTKEVADQAEGAAEQSKQAVGSIADAMTTSVVSLEDALHASSEGYAGVSSSLESALASSDTLASETAGNLRAQAAAAEAEISRFGEIRTYLETLKSNSGASEQNAIQQMIDAVDASIEVQTKLKDGLYAAADEVDAGRGNTAQKISEAQRTADEARASVQGLADDYTVNVKPGLENLVATVSGLADSMSGSAAALSDAGSQLQGQADSVDGKLVEARDKLRGAASDMTEMSGKLGNLSSALSGALLSGDSQQLRALLSSDTQDLASALAAPVQLDRKAVFPADNFGSQMAPLYTVLALWIGALLLVVAIRTNVSEKAIERLDKPRKSQLFLGRFGVFAVVSLCQTTLMGLGNMLFLGVQVSDPLLFMICFWASGLVFTFIIYSLVASFANLGKAIAVLLLIIQVTAGGGSFPLQVLPDMFQWVSPYLPATHAISAMRAAMMGVYANDFWIEMGCLALFIVPFALLGLVLRKPLMKFLNWYVEKVEDSKLVA